MQWNFLQFTSGLEEYVDSCVYVGRGLNLPYAEMWAKYDSHRYRLQNPADSEAHREIYDEVRKWLCMKEKDIKSVQMKRFKKYILEKEKKVTILQFDIMEMSNTILAVA